MKWHGSIFNLEYAILALATTVSHNSRKLDLNKNIMHCTAQLFEYSRRLMMFGNIVTTQFCDTVKSTCILSCFKELYEMIWYNCYSLQIFITDFTSRSWRTFRHVLYDGGESDYMNLLSQVTTSISHLKLHAIIATSNSYSVDFSSA